MVLKGTCFLRDIAMSKDFSDLNTVLMRSTFKLKGENSVGTAFMLSKPEKEGSKKGDFVLITAAHVLDKMKGDKASPQLYFILSKVKDPSFYLLTRPFIRFGGHQ